jgi:hypothetical protein
MPKGQIAKGAERSEEIGGPLRIPVGYIFFQEYHNAGKILTHASVKIA